MRTRLLATLAFLAAFLLFASPAFAQDEGASVVILKFDLLDVPESTTNAFYNALEAAINGAPEMNVKAGGEVGMQDLLLTVGCEEPTPDCLTGLRDFVDADRIVYGTIQRSEDVTLFTVRMFDFAEGRFVRETADQTVQGTEENVQEAIPAVVEAFVYGDTGVLTVDVSGADNAEIFFDGEKVGVAPMTLENLPLGQHAVSVKTRDGDEQTEKVLLRNAQPSSIAFDFEGGSVGGDGPIADSAGPSSVPGWIAVTVGAVGAGVGVYGLLEESSVESDLDARCGAGNEFGNVCSGSDAALASDAEAAEIQSLIDQGGTARTLQLAGFSVAAVGFVVGGYLLYSAYSADPVEESDANAGVDADDEPTVENVQFGFAPGPDGFSVGVGFDF